MWAISTGTVRLLKKKKIQIKSPSIWSRVPETGSDPPIGSDRESGRDMVRIHNTDNFCLLEMMIKRNYEPRTYKKKKQPRAI